MEIEYSSQDKLRGVIIPNKLSPELAYLCGVLIGDGSISLRKDKGDYKLGCVGNPKDEKSFYFKVIGPYFKKVFGFFPNIRYHDGRTTFGFKFGSKTLIKYLTNVIGLPTGKKYAKLKIPYIFKKDTQLVIQVIKGITDTDGCISFKKRYRTYPYYPVICISSKSKRLISDIAKELKRLKFRIVEIYNHKKPDNRIEKGFTIINRIELNGNENLKKWMSLIGFSSPKHLEKIKKYSKIAGGGLS